MISQNDKLDMLLDKIGALVERLAPVEEPPVDLVANLAFRWERAGDNGAGSHRFSVQLASPPQVKQ